MLACPQLFIHLSLLFNLFISHSHIPPLFMQSLIVPYWLNQKVVTKQTLMITARAIALSNTISKILESII